MHCGESNRLSPPIGVGAIAEKCIHQRVVELAGAYQIIAKFPDRLRPVISPRRTAVVNRRFSSSTYLRQTERCESWRESAPDLVIDPAFARPSQPPIPEGSHFGRLCNADRKEIGLDEQKRAARAKACNEISHRRFRIRNVMQYRTHSHEIERARLDRTSNDVALAQLKIWRAHVD